MPARKVSLVGTVDRTTIAAEILHVDGASQKHVGARIPHPYLITCTPRDLHITTWFSNAARERPAHVAFWLTPNSWLHPDSSRVLNYDGSITVERISTTTARLLPNETVTFDVHFEHLNQKTAFFSARI
jgi:hypothetical protein